MNGSSDSKTCPRCAESIKAAAKLCPFCQSRLSWFGLWQQELGGLAVALVLLGMLIAMGLWFDSRDSKGRSFERHQADLAVMHPALELAKKPSEFWLTGSVTNRGNCPWRIHEIEIRFLNPDGSLLDAQHPQVHEPFVVQPAQEGPFRLRLKPLPPASERARLQARVQVATDGNLPQEPD